MTKRDHQSREYANEAADIVTRLRDRAYSFKAPDPLLEEAANEIERLRWKAKTSESAARYASDRKPTLTPEEREAVKTAAGATAIWMADNGVTEDESMRRAIITIRGLLERLG